MAETSDPPAVILASSSATRRELLEGAGLAFTAIPADLDEGALRKKLEREDAGIAPVRVAEVLAVAKAEAVSRDHPHALVIGCDQVLALGNQIFEKPRDVEEARTCLMMLRGREHYLHSGVALAEGGRVSWTHTDSARLKMRVFSAPALDAYLAGAGEGVCNSVGAYKIEGTAIQLFEKIEGDYFTILGLPLLPLIAELISRKAVQA
jgi:septum formation protein